MTAYVCQLNPNVGGLTLRGGYTQITVEASSVADARAIAAGHFDGDAKDVWQNTDACAVTEVAVAADLSPVAVGSKDKTKFTLSVVINGATVNDGFSHDAVDGESFADVVAAMVVLLNADANITGAAFAADVLTVSSIGDNLGDHTLVANFTYGGVAIPSFLGAVVHEGIAGAVLSVATAAAPVLPAVMAAGKTS